MTEELSSEMHRHVVPVVMWHEEYEEAHRKLVEHGLAIGWNYAEELQSDIQSLHGLSIVFAVSENRADRFDGRTVDFKNDRFQLV